MSYFWLVNVYMVLFETELLMYMTNTVHLISLS